MMRRMVNNRTGATAWIVAFAACLGACEGDDGGPAVVEPPAPVDPRLCNNGEAAEFPCKGMDLVSRLTGQEIGVTEGGLVNDMWGWTDPVTRTEWALVGHSRGTAFVNLKDPDNPVYAGVLPLTDGAFPSLWRDMKVYRDHAFIVSDAAGPHGMQVFDLTRLRGVTNPPETFDAIALYDRIHSAHNIAINVETGFAYSVGTNGGGSSCGGGLHMIDIRAPGNPIFAGCFTDPSTGNFGSGYTHDATCVVYNGPDADHRGKEICFGSNETALSIADVSNKESPTALASASYPGVGYTHQGWLDEAHEYLYMNDEFDEFGGAFGGTRTVVWDVKDLDDPIPVKDFIGATEATDHNLYVVGDLMYQSNYLAGLRVINIADRENPVEVAFFDVHPGEDQPGFNGSWSNYPFFASGVIGVTSMDGGVFFVRLSAGN